MEVNIYWILDLGDEMHSIWELWRSGLQECKGDDFFESRVGWAEVFGRVQKIPVSFRAIAPAQIYLTRKACRG